MSSRLIANGEKHYVSTVYIISEEKPHKILLVHHKKFNKWMPPGGHQEKFENPYQAAIREVLEETGVDITNYLKKVLIIDDRASSIPIPDYIFEERIDPHGDQPEHYHIDMSYVVKVPIQEVSRQEEESYGIKWFSKEEAESVETFENVRAILNKIL